MTSASQIFRDSAKEWAESAVVWNGIAKTALVEGDLKAAAFAVTSAIEREEWAKHDELLAKRFEDAEKAMLTTKI